MLADCIKLTTDCIYGITQFLFGSLILLDNRLTLNVAFTMQSFEELSKFSNHNYLLFYLVSLPYVDKSWGIRLPDARIIWHMGKPNALRFGM